MAAPSKAKRRYGSETPRIWTPPLRVLNERTSLGYKVIQFAAVVCGVELLPWQKWLLIHALELAPGITLDEDLSLDAIHRRDPLDPIFRFRRIIVLVARQNGKSTLSQVLALFSMYVLEVPLVIGTAQDLDTAEEVWEGAVDIIEASPELAPLATKPVRQNGKKSIRLLKAPHLGVHGERYKVKAANRKAGRGLSGDLILLDELREHQTWEAWAAITKTTNARPAAQIWALSNAGDATSIVLRYLRKRAHADLGDPDGINAKDDPSLLLPSEEEEPAAAQIAELEEEAGTIGIFEWSAPPDCEVTDMDGIAQANPSMGYIISEKVLLADARDDPEWVFRTECLCQWSDGSLEGLFPAGAWESQLDPESSVAKGERIVACITVSHDRSRSHVAIAGLRDDRKTHVGVVASRAGTDWLAQWLFSDDSPPISAVVVQRAGAPESSLIEELRRQGVPVVEWGGPDLAKAHGSFYDSVARAEEGELRHRAQPVLEVAVATAVTKPLGEAWVVDLIKSAADAAPLKATIGAVWGLTNAAVSAYEDADYDLMV